MEAIQNFMKKYPLTAVAIFIFLIYLIYTFLKKNKSTESGFTVARGGDKECCCDANCMKKSAACCNQGNLTGKTASGPVRSGGGSSASKEIPTLPMKPPCPDGQSPCKEAENKGSCCKESSVSG
jgi:hypothetical protein